MFLRYFLLAVVIYGVVDIVCGLILKLAFDPEELEELLEEIRNDKIQ